MGQRHQVIVIYPEMFLNPGNCNNRPERAEVIHHQWLYGRTAIFALRRALVLAGNCWDGTGTDYMFGRADRGYTSGDGTQAIAAAMSVCPEEGYFHRMHLWNPEDWNGAETIKSGGEGYQYEAQVIRPQSLEPDMFDNNDGVTLIRFKVGERVPGYAFLTPNHLEGSHWAESDGRGPWTAREYLDFYYSHAEQDKWSAELLNYTAKALFDIERNGRVMDRAEVESLLPKFELSRAGAAVEA